MNRIFSFFLSLFFFFSCLLCFYENTASGGTWEAQWNKIKKDLKIFKKENSEGYPIRLVNTVNAFFMKSEVPIFLPYFPQEGVLSLFSLLAAAAVIDDLEYLKELEQKLGNFNPHAILYGKKNEYGKSDKKYTLFQVAILGMGEDFLILNYLHQKEFSSRCLEMSSQTGISPLRDAIAMRNIRAVEWLLDKNPNLIQERYGEAKRTPFHFAVWSTKQGDSDFILNYLKDLLKKSFLDLQEPSHLNLPCGDGSGITPFLDAAANGNSGVVNWLVDKNPNVISHSTSRGMTAIHAAVDGGHSGLAQHLLDLWRLLVEKNPDRIKQLKSGANKSRPEALWLLELSNKKWENPASPETHKLMLINPTEPEGLTLLHMASVHLDLCLAKLLLRYYGVTQAQVQTKVKTEYKIKRRKYQITIPAGFKASQIVELLQNKFFHRTSTDSAYNEEKLRLFEMSSLLRAAELIYLLEKGENSELFKHLSAFSQYEFKKILFYISYLRSDAKERIEKMLAYQTQYPYQNFQTEK